MWDESYPSRHLASVNANLPPVIAGGFKFNNAINESKESVIFAYTYIIAGVNTRAPLPNQYGPGVYLLPSISLHSKPLGLAIPTQTTGAAPLLMRHLESPLSYVAELS
jgi:hypothetical protein